MVRWGLVLGLVSLGGCGGCGDDGNALPDTNRPIDAAVDAARDAAIDARPDAPTTCSTTMAPTVVPTSTATCNALAQTGCAAGEKCTWRSDVKIIGCVPTGAQPVGCACSTGAGYDDCVGGAYCAQGICKSICDYQGGFPMCSSDSACIRHSGVFAPSLTSPPVAGLCDPKCSPLVDNDFDGSGTQFSKGSGCNATSGCYGFPSQGTPPVTVFTCAALGDPTLVHRSPTPTSTTFTNQCAQGYIPLFYESYAVQQVLCIAMCQPQNCYAGNCGTNAENRWGVAPHRCTPSDRLGTFDNALGAEHCRYLWSLEIDRGTGTFLRSQHSDTLGFCFDHSTFVYDSDNDGQFTSSDLPLPACADLQITGTHDNNDLMNPTVYWGASDPPLGCVDTVVGGVQLAPHVPTQLDFVRAAYGPIVQAPRY